MTSSGENRMLEIKKAACLEHAAYRNSRLTFSYAWKLLPQPQVLTALGLSNVKPRLYRPSS